MIRLTVFTPAYNRARTLPRLYDSLASQSSTDFEWVIVDDGSTDDTGPVVTALANRASFPVTYQFQPNRGKHAAMNAGVKAAHGELFWTVDSDDWLAGDVIEKMLRIWDAVTVNGRTDIAALTGLCENIERALIGDRFPFDVMESNSLEIALVHRVSGDKSGWTRTKVMREFPFPEGDHDFVPEGIVWNAIALRYRTVYINEVVLTVDYQADGLSHGGRRVSFIGMALYSASLLNEATDYLEKNPHVLLRTAASYSRFSRSSGVSWRTLVGDLRHPRMKVLVIALGPLGWWLRQRDRRAARARDRTVSRSPICE
jgi:glycosyltransferase involved in cell wall biosynthesis